MLGQDLNVLPCMKLTSLLDDSWIVFTHDSSAVTIYGKTSVG